MAKLNKSSLSEFSIIERYFKRKSCRADVLLGVGDDAALLQAGKTLVVSTDTLNENIHFVDFIDPRDLGRLCLKVNLSDLAAMGAKPCWVTLSLSLPEANASWLESFARGFFELADEYGVELIGGDTTQGPLSINVTALGAVDAELALRRDRAKVGDFIYVSDVVGDNACAVKSLLGGEVTLSSEGQPYFYRKLYQQKPFVALGLSLLGVANAAIDVSDGLLGDLQHILDASGVGARVYAEKIPLSDELRAAVGDDGALECGLVGGYDYVLCFTVPESRANQVPDGCRCIGEIAAEKGLTVLDDNGTAMPVLDKGFEHFG